MTKMHRMAAVVTVALAVGLTACSRGPLKISGIQMGSALNSDKSIATHVSRFRPDQTVYVAVLTDGPGSGELGVRWTLAGRVISEETKKVSYTQGAATEFHISYAGGFPTGQYKVDILVDGEVAESRDFRVES